MLLQAREMEVERLRGLNKTSEEHSAGEKHTLSPACVQIPALTPETVTLPYTSPCACHSLRKRLAMRPAVLLAELGAATRTMGEMRAGMAASEADRVELEDLRSDSVALRRAADTAKAQMTLLEAERIKEVNGGAVGACSNYLSTDI